MAKKPVGSFYVQLGLNTKEFRKNLNSSRRDLKNAFGPAAIRASQTLATAMTGLSIAMAGVAAASVKLVADLERQEVALTRIMGSADGAKKRLKELQEFAAVTPYTFTELVEYEKRLRALGFAAEDVHPTLVTLGDAASGLGLDKSGVDRLIKAFGDIRAKGYLQTQEIRQLAEAGVAANEILAKKLGVTIPELMKLTENRAIDAATAIGALVEGINERFGGMMELQSKTLIGMMSTIRDEGENTLRIFGGMITESTNLQSVVRSVRDAARQFREDLENNGFAEAFSGILGEKAKAAIIVTAGAITGALIPAVISLKAALSLALIPLAKMAAIGAAIAAAGYGIYRVWKTIGPAVKETFQALKFALTEEVPKLVDYAFAKIKSSFWRLMNEISQVMFAHVQRLPGEAANYWKPFFGNLIESVSSNAKQASIETARAFKNLKFAEDFFFAMQEARASTDRYKYGLDGLTKTYANLKARAEAFWGPQAAQIASFARAIGMFKKPGEPAAAQTSTTETAAPVDNTSLIKDAESISRSIKEAWLTQTQDRLTQLDYQYQKEKESLEKSKAFNQNYRRDLFMLDETYYQQRVALTREANEKEATALADAAEQRGRDIEEQVQYEQRLAEAKFERIQADIDGSATEAQLREYHRQADLEGYIEYLDQEKAAYRAHLEGRRSLMEVYNQMEREANRTNADYAAEGYRTVYHGLSDALTQVITGTKSAGEAFKQLGLQIVQMFVKWQVQRKIAAAMSKSMEVAQVATSTAMAATTAAAWAPAAAMVAAATFGASTATAAAGLTSLTAMSRALAIPGLADGGIVTKPTLAMIGEGGESEAVIPLSKLGQIGGSGNITINVNNNSGVPVQARASQSMDGGRMVVDLFLEGYSRNVSGIQDIIGART